MNRRFGISILGVLSLTTGVLVAEYAFAPLREQPSPMTEEASAQPDAESTASPREAAPTAPANQRQQISPPIELRTPAREVEGDPMVAQVRPVIDAVWQDVTSPTMGDVRVSLASTAAPAAVGEPATRLAAANISQIGLGGTFLGTQGGRASGKVALLPEDSSEIPSDIGAVVTDTVSAGPGISPDETLARNDAPSSPAPKSSVPQDGLDPATPPRAELVTDAATPSDPAADRPDEIFLEQPLPHVTVPEPLPATLFLLGILLGALSRRRR